MNKIIIIGAGPAGLSAAYHLKSGYELFEKEKESGGLLRSKNINGFIFDYAGHIFSTRDRYVTDLINKLLGDNVHFQDRSSWVYSKGKYTPYPFQANTFGLPVEVVKECLLGAIKAHYENLKYSRPLNFKEWIYARFGEGIARHFMLPYNSKLWTVPLEEMDCAWINSRIPEPGIEEVLEGALSSPPQSHSKFGYPLRGGCGALPNSFGISAHLNAKITHISLSDRTVTVNDKERIGYDRLISTMPLPELIRIIDGVPPDVLEVCPRLRFVSLLCVNLGFARSRISEKHWIYYPEKEFVFHRNFIQSNISPYLCPEGTSSITCEISYSPYKRIDKEKIVERVVNDLILANYIDRNDEILAEDVVDIEYAYIVPDIDYKSKIKKAFDFLESNRIYSAGRFAEWEYYDTDDAILSGKRIAERINKC